MSCSNCFNKYGFFSKEHGCPLCHRSLCSRCLPEKLPVPSLGDKKAAVCRKCYNAATTLEDEAPALMPPQALIRRMETLENPARPPITVYRQSARATSMKRGLSREDSELVDRLEALRQDRKPKYIPTEQEMAERLAALKDQTHGVAGPSTASNLPAPETRSAAEQEEALLDQTRGEVAIAGRYRPEQGLHERLAKLRGLPPDQETAPPAEETPACTDQQTAADLLSAAQKEVQQQMERANQVAQRVAAIGSRLEECRGGKPIDPGAAARAETDTADPSEEQEVQKLIRQIQESALLEQKEMDEELESASDDGDELPWCCICNEDATVRCAGCDGDLYCGSCYREGHADQLRDHRSTPFPAA